MDRRAKDLARYKETVRRCALGPGPQLPVVGTEAHPIMIRTRAYFRDRRHGDPESIHRAVKDALWPHKNGGDKYTGGSYDFPLYDPDDPRVEVEIRW